MGSSKRKNTKKTTQEEPEEYEVERIISHRLTKDEAGKPQLEYYLKWKNYTSKYNTWEPSAAVSAEELIDDYWESAGGQQTRQDIMSQLEGTHKRKASKETPKMKANKKPREINTDFYESDSDMDFSESELEDETFRANTSWKEVYKIKTVRPGDDNKTLYAIVRWSDGSIAKYPTSLVTKKLPAKLIEYYEKRLLFEKANST